MPTFTAIALDSLLEQGSRHPKTKPPPAPARAERQLSLPPVAASEKKSIPPRPAASPILYATPALTVCDVPDSPSSFPPSPYIINHKRRGPRLGKSLSQECVPAEEPRMTSPEKEMEVVEVVSGDGGVSNGGKSEEVGNGAYSGMENGVNGKGEEEADVALDVERNAESDEFLDFQDSMSALSSTDVEDNTPMSTPMAERLWKPSTPMGEYYDAFEELSSCSASRSSGRNIEDELREMRLNLFTEIEKRKQTEEAFENLQNQWQRLSRQLALVGLTLPSLPATGEQPNPDPAEELCCQVTVSRAVATAIGRACARAEFEMEMKPQIETKNFEIARLSDRLQYYEAANREMSQRNQEAVEAARQQRNRRKRLRRWILGSIGLAATLGAAAVAWSYAPSSTPSSHEGETTSLPKD